MKMIRLQLHERYPLASTHDICSVMSSFSESSSRGRLSSPSSHTTEHKAPYSAVPKLMLGTRLPDVLSHLKGYSIRARLDIRHLRSPFTPPFLFYLDRWHSFVAVET